MDDQQVSDDEDIEYAVEDIEYALNSVAGLAPSRAMKVKGHIGQCIVEEEGLKVVD